MAIRDEKMYLVEIRSYGDNPSCHFRLTTQELGVTLDVNYPSKTFANNPKGLLPEVFQTRQDAIDYCHKSRRRIWRSLYAIVV